MQALNPEGPCSASFKDPEGHRIRVLISTIVSAGGVDTMLEFILRLMRQRDYEAIVAHYEPYSRSPQLSVPATALIRRAPGLQLRDRAGLKVYAIGS
jgi:hypothetical protein